MYDGEIYEAEDRVDNDSLDEVITVGDEQLAGTNNEKEVTVRKNFPEAWIFDEYLETGYPDFFNTF